MRKTFQRYEDYDGIDVEWIGEIPEHWNVQRVKELAMLVLGKMLDNKPAPGKCYRHYLKSKNITWFKVDISSVDQMYFTSNEMKSYRLKTDDLLLSEGGEVGKTSIWRQELDECYIQNSVHKVTVFKNQHPQYYLYQSVLLGQLKYYDSIVNQVSIKHLTKDKLSRVFWLCPPLKEQKAIAHYLDTKTAQIDRKIDLLTQKAQRYEELKRSLINETVTRGLDKSVPMKDSGIEWIGEIPEHWEIHRIKDFTYVKGRIGWQGLRSSDFLDTGDYYCVTGTDLVDGLINWSDCYFVSKSRYEQDKYIQLKSGDLLITKDGTIGKTALVDALPKEATLNSGLFVTRPLKDKYLNVFLYWVLNSSVFRNYIDLTKGGSTIQHLYQNVFDRFLYCCPPLTEQKEISDYLSRKSSHIDQIIQNINLQIETLKELRKTLINDVVTGKIKVT